MSQSITVNGKKFFYDQNTNFLVQVGKGEKGSYATRYSFEGNLNKATFYYSCINIGNGYKKRFVMVNGNTKTIVARALS